MATDKYDLHTIDYSVQGWDSILATDMEKLDDVIHSRIEATAGETMAQYDAVRLESDGKYGKALGDGAQQPSVGLALESAILDDAIRIHRIGPITNAGWTWATVGAPVYLSDANLGVLVDVKPAANAQIMGVVLTATSVFVWPDLGGGGGAPDAHATSHENAGGDEISVAGLSGLLADDQHVLDVEVLAVAAAKGVNADITSMTGLDDSGIPVAKVDGALANIVEDATPQLGGTLELNEKTILVNAALAADGTWTGPTQSVTAGEELTIGEVAYLKADGKYWLADADAEATADTKLVMATATIVADATGIVLLPSALSFMRVDATTEWAVTGAGDVMFLSTTAGELTNDISGYTTGDIVRICGYMETATVLNFDVDKTFIEMA